MDKNKPQVLTQSEIEDVREKLMGTVDVAVTCEFFKALSDPTRICIVNALQLHRWLCVSDLALILNMSHSAVSHQLAYLRLNNLVKSRREGKRAYYALCDDHVEQVFAMAVSHVYEDEEHGDDE